MQKNRARESRHDIDVRDWMAWRDWGAKLDNEIAGLLERTEDSPSERTVTARKGDSISRLLGTNDHRAIGRFIAANGMSGQNSVIYAGRRYVVPNSRASEIDGDSMIGRRLLAQDNAKLERAAEDRRRSELFVDRLNNGLNVWTGLPASRSVSESSQKRSPVTSNRRRVGDELPKRLFGAAIRQSAQQSGAVRGASNTIGDIFKTADFAMDLIQDDAARQQLGRTARAAGQYAENATRDREIVRRDLKSGFENWRRKVDPTATPLGATWADEFQRSLEIGLNQGELAFDVGSVFYGAPALKAATKVGRIARKTAGDFEAQGFTPAKARYLAEDYTGVGHHSVVPRRGIKTPVGTFKLPEYLLDSPLNVVKPKGISRGDFYELHYGLDGQFYGARLSPKLGTGGWSGNRLGLQRYGPAGRLWYGTPDPMKAIVGTGGAGGGLLLYDTLEDGEANYGAEDAR